MRFLLMFTLLFSTSVSALTLMTINTEFYWDDINPHECSGKSSTPDRESKYSVDAEAFIYSERIKNAKADIVVLTEIEGKGSADRITSFLGSDWKVVFSKGRDSGTCQDVAILTNLVPDFTTVTTFKNYYGDFPDSDQTKRPSKVLGVEITDDAKTYYVIAAHLISKRGNNDAKRVAQADAIRKAIRDLGEYDHIIVMGDLNDTPGSDPLNRIKGNDDQGIALKQTAGLGMWTYDYRGKLQLIDHILVSDFKSAECWTYHKAPVSDHKPLACSID